MLKLKMAVLVTCLLLLLGGCAPERTEPKDWPPQRVDPGKPGPQQPVAPPPGEQAQPPGVGPGAGQ